MMRTCCCWWITNPSRVRPVYIEDVYECLREHKQYQTLARRKTRCVKLDYAGDVHLDIVPCVSFDDTQNICNRDTDEFEPTDGTGFRDWFNDKNRETSGNLKRVTRLLKYMRDHKGNFTAPSVLLTTLVGNTVDGTGGVRFSAGRARHGYGQDRLLPARASEDAGDQQPRSSE